VIESAPEFFSREAEFRRSSVGSGGMMNRRAMSRFVRNPLKVAETVEKIFEDDLHARRVLSLANGVVGTIEQRCCRSTRSDAATRMRRTTAKSTG
jgi:hypothetical protein